MYFHEPWEQWLKSNQRNNFVLASQLDTAYAGSGTAHRADRVFFKAHNFTGSREQHNFVLTGGQIDANQLVAFVEVNRNNTG